MKKLIILFAVSTFAGNAYSQQPNLDSILHQLPVKKSDSAQFYLAFSALTTSETNPVDDMSNAEAILVYGQRYNDKMCLFQGFGCLSYDYLAFGNTNKSLEYGFKTKEVADNSNEDRLEAPADYLLAAVYFELADYAKSKAYSLQALEKSVHVEPNIFTIMINIGMGEVYLATDKIDSALVYTQKAYELSINTGLKYYLCSIYKQLGTIQSKLNNPALALNYLNLSLQEATIINSPKYINLAHKAIADYYMKSGEKDSVVYHAKKAIEAVQNTPFSTSGIKAAKILLDIYRGNNIDSAFKYSEIYRIANDSLFNFKKIQQAQLMTFEEDARQKEIAVEKLKAEEERQLNIQYALIALGIIIFVTLFLLLSRTVVVNEKLISFFAVLGLLVIFEFINLLIHPWLANFTHESPVLMLLALVLIAALLIPIHHRLEHWIKERMVEKNKAIRLAAARKTIEKLEKKHESV